MTKQVQRHNGKGIVYLDKHPLIVRARNKFETAKKEDIFKFDQRSFYWEIANYFSRFFRNDKTYHDIWHDYAICDRDIRYTNLPISSPYFPVLGVHEDNVAYALFLLNPTPILDKDDKHLDSLSDGIAILNPDFRIRGVSCLFTSDLYDKVCDKLRIHLKVPPVLSSSSEGALKKYEQSLAEAKQELGNICVSCGITRPIRNKLEVPKIAENIREKFRYKGSFGVWLP